MKRRKEDNGNNDGEDAAARKEFKFYYEALS